MCIRLFLNNTFKNFHSICISFKIANVLKDHISFRDENLGKHRTCYCTKQLTSINKSRYVVSLKKKMKMKMKYKKKKMRNPAKLPLLFSSYYSTMYLLPGVNKGTLPRNEKFKSIQYIAKTSVFFAYAVLFAV